MGGVGGPSRSLVQAAAWLRDHGGIEFVVPEEGPAASAYRQFGPVTVASYGTLVYARGPVGLGSLVRSFARDLRWFRRELRRRRPDVVIVVTTVLPAVLVAARLERVPAVVYAAEIYDQRWKQSPLLRLWGRVVATATAALAHGLVCCSATVAEQFRSRPGKPLTIAYPPVGPEYAGGGREQGRHRYGMHDADPCLLVVGSLSRGRGQDVALHALRLLRNRFPDARLLIVGAPHPRATDLEFAAELRLLATRLGVADAVVFAEPTDAMADVYAAADVVVNPARFAEPFGRVAPEALVAGKPVVASRLGAIPEVLRDGIDGLLVDPDDPEAVAEAVARLVDDPALARELVEAGRQRVREHFGYEQDLAAWTAVLAAATARSAGVAGRG